MQFYFAETPTLRLKVSCTVRRGHPGCHTLPNGDPGYPPEPDELQMESILVEKFFGGQWCDTGIDLLGWLWEDEDETPLTKLAEEAYNKWDEYEDRMRREAYERSFPEDV